MNGTFLLVIGVAWSRFNLAGLYQTIAYWSLVYGTFANWLFVTFAALFGTSAMTPIAGSGHQGLAWQENLVSQLFCWAEQEQPLLLNLQVHQQRKEILPLTCRAGLQYIVHET